MIPEPGAEAGLVFPLDWQGKVLAQADADDVSVQVERVMQSFGLQATTTAGNRSSAGRYVTYTVHAIVPDRLTLQQLSYALSHIPGVKVVL